MRTAMKRDEFPAPREGFVLTHFLTSNDVVRSCAFYSEVLGGKVVLNGEPSIVLPAHLHEAVGGIFFCFPLSPSD